MRCASLVVISGLLLAPAAQAAIYKCAGADGRVSFSSTPCGGALASDENRLEVKPSNIGGSFGVSAEQRKKWQQQQVERPTTRPAAPAPRDYCKSYSSTTLRTMIIGNHVEPGMDASAVARSWGKPNKVNEGDPVQWVYYWPQSTAYVYFVDNCVWQVDGGYKN